MSIETTSPPDSIHKKCSKCNVVKLGSEFYEDKSKSIGLSSYCKICRKVNSMINNYKKPKKGPRLLASRTEKICPSCEILKSAVEFYKDKRKSTSIGSYCKSCHNIRTKLNNLKNKDKITTYKKEYYIKNKIKVDEKNKLWRKKNPERARVTAMEWANKNKDSIREKRKIYRRERCKIDPFFKLTRTIRTRLRDALRPKKWNKSKGFSQYIGCDKETFLKYIESQFQVGMTWENHSLHGWHIDHIYPLSLAINEEHLYELCHYTNLRPLWATENRKKSNKVINVSPN